VSAVASVEVNIENVTAPAPPLFARFVEHVIVAAVDASVAPSTSVRTPLAEALDATDTLVPPLVMEQDTAASARNKFLDGVTVIEPEGGMAVVGINTMMRFPAGLVEEYEEVRDADTHVTWPGCKTVYPVGLLEGTVSLDVVTLNVNAPGGPLRDTGEVQDSVTSRPAVSGAAIVSAITSPVTVAEVIDTLTPSLVAEHVGEAMPRKGMLLG